MCHNVAEIYRMKDRGYLRKGYFADMVLVDLRYSWQVASELILYKCNWSPFEQQSLNSKVLKTFVNGNLIYDNGAFNETQKGRRLKFEKIR